MRRPIFVASPPVPPETPEKVVQEPLVVSVSAAGAVFDSLAMAATIKSPLAMLVVAAME